MRRLSPEQHALVLSAIIDYNALIDEGMGRELAYCVVSSDLGDRAVYDEFTREWIHAIVVGC